jgi:uncharacterized lipoprotein YddW (UPF0748 family)
VKVTHKTWLTLLIGLGFMLSLLGHYVPVAAQPGIYNATSSELRGVWLTNLDSDVLLSQERLKESFDRLSRLNFNTVYPTVWNWGYTLYPSGVAQRATGHLLTPTAELKGRDMLAEAVRYGHQRGLSVIPWFEFGLMAPADSELVRRHPNWVSRRQDGRSIFKKGQYDRVWLNPFHPEVQQFMVDLISEVVLNYDVDGIQLDDHFGLPVELGYDPYTVALYRKDHWGKRPPTYIHNAEWKRWRANKMTALMQQITLAVKAHKPNCLVTLSPNPHSFAYHKYLQDWATWERQGLLDELILQVYRDDFNAFVQLLESPEVAAAQQHIPVGVGILAGLRVKSIPIEQIQAQVQAVRERGFAGISFFFYETLGDRDEAFQALFPSPTRRPSVLQSLTSRK